MRGSKIKRIRKERDRTGGGGAGIWFGLIGLPKARGGEAIALIKNWGKRAGALVWVEWIAKWSRNRPLQNEEGGNHS